MLFTPRNTNPLLFGNTVNEIGEPELVLTPISATSEVPAAVPSVRHNSVPVAAVCPAKKTSPPVAADESKGPGSQVELNGAGVVLMSTRTGQVCVNAAGETRATATRVARKTRGA